jgi:hypothetical protein
MVKQALAAVRFDWSISVGNILSMLTAICLIAGAWFTMKSDVRDLTSRISSVEKAADKRDADHDRLIELAADVKFIRTIVERRADSTPARLPHP